MCSFWSETNKNVEERQVQDLSASLGSDNFRNINTTNFQTTSIENLIISIFLHLISF